MKRISVLIQETSNPKIIKFETNSFLTDHESFEYQNIDDAKNSPLAQQLFYLPFVKKIYISANFVAIERFEIVEWNDVQNEVAQQIETYLNEGGIVVTSSSETKKIPITVYAEVTPNPAVIKFVTNKKIVLQTLEFKSIDDAINSPFATELFRLPFVKSVFLDENYISITKYDVADWNDITMELREFIKLYLEQGKTIITESETNSEDKKSVNTEVQTENLDDISKEIVSILDEYIKPAVASDGGNIVFHSYDPDYKKVKVILQGACSGCPSSTITLKNGIENMLKEMLHGKVELVEAING
jgi:Fe-S cluster biogenesis protein NfuA